MRKTRSFCLYRVSQAVLATAGFATLALAPDALFAAIQARVEEASKNAIAKAQRPPVATIQLAQASDAASEETEPANPFGVWGTVQDWLARANREYQGIIVRELSLPSSGETPEDAIAQTRDRQRAEEARRAAEARAAADRRAEAQRAAEKAAAAAEAAEAKRRAEQKLAEDRQRAEETRRLADEAKRQADDIARALSEAAPQPDPAAEAAAAAKQAELQRREAEKLAEESRRQQEAEKARQARLVEERRKADEANRAEQERRLAEAQAAAARHSKRTIVLKVEPIERPEAVTRPADVRVAGDVRRATVDDEEATESTSTKRQIHFYPDEGPEPVAVAYRSTAHQQHLRKVENRCRNAGRRIRPPGRYVVKRGDSLWRISKRFYRNGVRWRKIYRANRRTIKNPHLIYPCQRVFVPKRHGRHR